MIFTSYQLLILLFFTNKLFAEDQLLFVFEYARHGARYPVVKNISWNLDPMGLTSVGMRQHYLIGRELRHRYIEHYNLLDSHYNPSQIIMRSSQNSRTIASLLSQLAGFYLHGQGNALPEKMDGLSVPPNSANYTKWISELGLATVNYFYQILPVYSIEKDKDIYFEPQDACKTVDKVTDYYKEDNAEDIIDMEEKFSKEIYPDIAKAFNLKEIKDMHMATDLRDVLISGLSQGTLENVDDKTAQKLIDQILPVYQYEKYNLVLQAYKDNYLVSKLMATPMLHHLKDSILNATYWHIARNYTKSCIKYILNVGSDGLMHALLLQLGHNSDKKSVPFASVMLFELFKTQSKNTNTIEDYYVSFKYNNQIKMTYSMKEFIDLIEKNTYSDTQFHYYCYDYTIDFDNETSMILFICIGIGILILILIAVFAILLKFHKQSDKEIIQENTLSDSITNS